MAPDCWFKNRIGSARLSVYASARMRWLYKRIESISIA